MQEHMLYTIIVRDKKYNYLINVFKYDNLHDGYRFVKNRYPHNDVVIKVYDPYFNLVSPDMYMQAE